MFELRTLPRQIISMLRYPRLFLLSKRMGKNTRLGPGGRIRHHKEIYMGDNIYIAPDFHISARNLRIGSNILIGPRLLLECDDHIFREIGKSIWDTRHERNVGYVTIEDDVWIGGNVTVLKNVTISEGCIVGASSTVVKSLPPYTICFGNPCRPVKARFNKDELSKHITLVSSKYKLEYIIEQWKIHGVI